MSKILEGLNAEQKRAVTTTEGPVLILAGAGSGKTRTLTSRIAYIIDVKDVNPEHILAVTFTNKAAAEMISRASSFVDKEIVQDRPYPFFRKNYPAFGTFHSICAKIMRDECEKLGYKQSFAIYDADDQLKLIKGILKDLNLDEKRNNPRTVLNIISTAKNELKTPDELAEIVDSSISEIAAKVYPIYQDTLKKNNAFDFDDLLMKTVELFQNFPKVLEYYRDLWRYIHVDEYQDTNFAQYTMIKLLAEKYKNICVVGDPDQSIYGWRGADIRNILDFEKDYKNINVIKLEQNYRSTKTILKAAQNIIEKNKSRKEKSLWTDNEEGDKIKIELCEDERDEGNTIISDVNSIVRGDADVSLQDCVVLYRTNAQSRSLEESCLRYAVPYRIVGGVKFYERKEIKDILAYLRLVLNPSDDLSCERIINVPPRGIGKTTITKIKILANDLNTSMMGILKNNDIINSFTPKIRSGIEGFIDLMESLNKRQFTEEISTLITSVFEDSGYKKFLHDDSTENEARIENIEELLSVSQKYDHLEKELGLLYFLEEVSLLTDADRSNDDANKLTLMTMHSAKGLEYKYVFVAGAEENIFPHQRSQVDYEEMEEERRLAYVCITRAEKKLSFYHTRRRMLYGNFSYNDPSRFLYDIPSDITEGAMNKKFKAGQPAGGSMFSTDKVSYNYNSFNDAMPEPDVSQEPPREIPTDLKDGDKIKHDTFGEGRVVSRQGDIIKVVFGSTGVKTLVLSIAPIRKI